MADGKTLIAAGAAGAGGAVVTALGKAFGTKKRLDAHTKEIKELQDAKAQFITKLECDQRIENTKELTKLQFAHHSEQIADLKKSQQEGFNTVFNKLDDIQRRIK